MPDEQKTSKRTMRIDLLPDVPSEPVAKRKIVVTRGAMAVKNPAQSKTRDLAGDAQFNALFQNIYDAGLVCDLEGKVVDANARAMEFFLYDRGELTGLSLFDLISGVDESFIRTICNNLENERFVLITAAYCVRKDGTYFISEISVNKLNLGTMHLCFFIRDITIRKQHEDMLITEHNAIQNSGNGIAVADMDGVIEYLNPAMVEMWGYSTQDELEMHNVRELFGDTQNVEAMISAVGSQHQDWTGEIKARRRDGVEFDIQVSAACNRNSDGEPVGMVFSFVDISDRKRAEVAVRDAERNRVMLESLGAACHHLGQPATVLLANLGIMQKKLVSQDPLVTDLMQSSIEAIETLGEILHKLNTVNEYKTTAYLESPDGSDSSNRIIEI